jgi:gliding motility-associated-like protein
LNKSLVIAIILFCGLKLNSQNFNQTYWHFGETSKGLYFDAAGNAPVVTNNSYTPYTNEGCSVFNDPLTGELRFYTDGLKVVDANGDIMPNGSGLQGHISCFGSGKIAVDPNNCNRIYIFHNSTDMSFNSYGSVRYSIVDMTLPGNGSVANPLGDVVVGSKNILITSEMAEGAELVPRLNSRDYWLLLTDNINQTIEVFLLDNTGLNFFSSIPLLGDLTDIRAFRISPLYTKGAIASLRENEETIIFDFDPFTGAIMNQQILPGTPMGNNSGWYGIFDVEWSSDGSKLYMSKYRGINPDSGGKLFQYDTSLPFNAPVLIHQISNNSTNLGRGLRRGPDGKIYWIYHNPTTNSTQYIAAVNSPNLQGSNCDFVPISIDMGSTIGNVHLFPSFLEYTNSLSIIQSAQTQIQIPCNNPNTQLQQSITQWVPDPEGDSLTITSATVDFGTITFDGPNIIFTAPPNFLGIASAHISYCDDYCYPQCSEFDLEILVSTEGSSSDPLPGEINCATTEATIGLEIPGYQYNWGNGETTPFINVTQSGYYYYSADNGNGCQVFDTVLVNISELPIELLAEDDILVCDQNTLQLNVDQSGYDLLWSTGQTTQAITVVTSDMYFVQTGEENYCLLIDSINVVFDETPDVSLPNQLITMCDDNPIQLTANCTIPTTYNWSTGEVAEFVIATDAGVYTVTVSNQCGSDEASVTVEEQYTPVVDLGADITQCYQIDTTLQALFDLQNYLWSDGSTNEVLTITEPGSYSLSSSNICGTDQDFVEVFLSLPNSLSLDASNVICVNEQPILSLNNFEGYNYLWSTGDTASTIQITQSGIYTLYSNNACGAYTTELFVNVDSCLNTIYIPNAFTPNGDGINDIWFVQGQNISNIEVEIFNRWGEKIFQSDAEHKVWTGNVHQGEYYAQDGIYIFQVSYKTDGIYPHRIRGHITLLR